MIDVWSACPGSTSTWHIKNYDIGYTVVGFNFCVGFARHNGRMSAEAFQSEQEARWWCEARLNDILKED